MASAVSGQNKTGKAIACRVMLISSLVILALGAILAITDIALTGVDVSRRKVSTSKLCSPIISLLLPILLVFAFLFMY